MEGLAGLPRHVGRRPRADANLGVSVGIRGGPDIPPHRGRHFSRTHLVKRRPGHGRRPPVFADPGDVVSVHRGPGALVSRAPAPDGRPGTPATSRGLVELPVRLTRRRTLSPRPGRVLTIEAL